MSVHHASRISRLTCTRAFASAAADVPHRSLGGLSAVVREKAERLSTQWKGTNASGGSTKNYIGGEFRESSTDKWVEVLDPVSASE